MCDFALAKLRNYLLANGARSEYESATVMKLSEYALCQFYAGGGHGHRPRSKISLGAHAFAGLERTLEQTIENRPSGALLVRGPVGFPHLTENFGFAEHHGIEARGNAEKMPHGFAVVMVIKRNAKNVRTDEMKLAEKRGKPWRALTRSFRRDSVHFAAVARGEHQRFL